MNDMTLPGRGGALTTASDDQMMHTLQNSLYPGAKKESVAMVLAYCQAAQLDPFQKPVHIVPMYVEDKATGQKGMRDVIMPGIGLYRTQAARSGRLAGIDEPEFGPDVEHSFGEFKIVSPEWCSVTIYRIVDNQKCAFTAKEYWLENYATAGRDSKVPNSMWKKRPRGQIAKCAEAQALRKAFPEVGSAPTAEEMDGHGWEGYEAPSADTGEATIKQTKSRSKTPAPPPADVTDAKVVDASASPAAPAAPAEPAAAQVSHPGTGKKVIEAGQVNWLKNKIASFELAPETVAQMLVRQGMSAQRDLSTLDIEEFDKLRAELMAL